MKLSAVEQVLGTNSMRIYIGSRVSNITGLNWQIIALKFQLTSKTSRTKSDSAAIDASNVVIQVSKRKIQEKWLQSNWSSSFTADLLSWCVTRSNRKHSSVALHTHNSRPDVLQITTASTRAMLVEWRHDTPQHDKLRKIQTWSAAIQTFTIHCKTSCKNMLHSHELEKEDTGLLLIDWLLQRADERKKSKQSRDWSCWRREKHPRVTWPNH